MWDYSDTVKEHFFNPRNAGELAAANATGDVGSISCGDALRLQLKVNPDTEIIEDAGFQTFGCGSAIASSSALTEIIKGKTLDEALKVSNQDIADYLEGLPPEKMHCSVMGREALQAAIADYKGEEWKDDHEEGELICKCFAIDAVMIEETIRANDLSSVEDVTNYTKAGGGCSSCHEGIEEILTKVLAEKGIEFDPESAPKPQVAPLTEPTEKTPAVAKIDSEGSTDSGMSSFQRIKKIEAVIEKVRPTLQADRGDIELIDVQGNRILVHLVGACAGCQMAGMTLGGVQQHLMEALGEFVQVIPVQKKAVHAVTGA